METENRSLYRYFHYTCTTEKMQDSLFLSPHSPHCLGEIVIVQISDVKMDTERCLQANLTRFPILIFPPSERLREITSEYAGK